MGVMSRPLLLLKPSSVIQSRILVETILLKAMNMPNRQPTPLLNRKLFTDRYLKRIEPFQNQVKPTLSVVFLNTQCVAL